MRDEEIARAHLQFNKGAFDGEPRESGAARRRLRIPRDADLCTPPGLLNKDGTLCLEGRRLAYRLWRPRDRPVKLVLVRILGLNESARWVSLLEFHRWVHLLDAAICVLEPEGHGFSDGPWIELGANGFDGLVDDTLSFVRHVREEESFLEDCRDVPFFTLGESMGGAVNFYLSTRYKRQLRALGHRGSIFSAPMLGILLKPPEYQIKLLQALRWIFPKAKLIPRSAIIGSLCWDNDMRRRLRDGPFYSTDMFKTELSCELLDTSLHIATCLDLLDVPFLVLHGTADRMTSPTLSEQLFAESRSKDKTLHLVEDGPHCLFLEPSTRQESCEVVKQWIEQRSV
ncbi:MAG: hypothetical protein MHM6MM_001309 [Cercozoa sp. M6MM]